MKYEIVKVPNLELFQEKLSTKTNTQSHLLCLHDHKKITSFAIHHKSSMEMMYRNDVSGDHFKIGLEFLTVDFSLDVKRGNSCCWKSSPLDPVTGHKTFVDHSVAEHGVQLFGITVADLLKCYYKKSSFSSSTDVKVMDKKEEKEASDFTEEKRENDLVNSHIKKGATRIEVKVKDLNNVLGMCNGNLICPWDNFLSVSGVNNTSNVKKDFTAFCSKYLFFPSSAFLNIRAHTDYKNSEPHDSTVSEKKCLEFFEKLVSKNIVSNLVRHFLFGENLNGSPDLDKIFVYDPPQKLTDILLNFSKSSTGNQENNDFLERYKKITGHINKREEKELMDKYPEWTFDSLAKIPEVYPIWGLRNVYLRSWSHSQMWLMYQHYDYPRKVKLGKFKFKRSVAIKERHQTVEWGHCYSPRNEKGEHKEEELKIKSSMTAYDSDNAYGAVDVDSDDYDDDNSSIVLPPPTQTTLLDYFPDFIRKND